MSLGAGVFGFGGNVVGLACICPSSFCGGVVDFLSGAAANFGPADFGNARPSGIPGCNRDELVKSLYLWA